MRNRLFTFLFVISALLIHIQWANATGPAVVGKKVSLVWKSETITYVEIMNTHARTYKDITGPKLSLKENVKGVLWKVLCVGIKMDKPFDKIILRNEDEEMFVPMTNVIETSENRKASDKNGNVLYEGPTTSFFLAGPDNSRHVTVMFGASSVKIDMEK